MMHKPTKSAEIRHNDNKTLNHIINSMRNPTRTSEMKHLAAKQVNISKRIKLIIKQNVVAICVCLLIFVPFQSEVSHCYQFDLGPAAARQAYLRPPTSTSQLNIEQLNQQADLASFNYPTNIPQVDTANTVHQFDWAKRLSSSSSSSLGSHEENSNLLPISDTSNESNSLILMSTQQQQQPLQQAPARPTILKNLINSTLESIVSHQKQLLHDNQQPRLLAAARDLIRTQMINQHQPQVGGLRFMPATSVGNRLYSFLFPQANQPVATTFNQQQQQQQQQQHQLLRSSNTSGGQLVEQIHSASSNINQDTDHSEHKSTGRAGDKNSPLAGGLISLSAPYEQRPRRAHMKGPPKLAASLLPSASSNTRTVSSHDRWHPDGAPTSQDLETLEQQQQQQSTGNDSAPMEHQENDNNRDHYEPSSSPNEFQWTASSPLEMDSTATDNTTEDTAKQSHSSQAAELPPQMVATLNELDEEQQQQQQHQHQEEEAEADGQHADNNSTNLDEGQQQQQMALNESAAHDFMANRLNNLTVAMLEPSLEADSNNETNNPAGYNLTPAQQVEAAPELAVQLPSQYESIMRMPPEGHYDDYFKPSGGGLHHAARSNRSLLLNEDQSLQDYSLALAEHQHQEVANSSIESANDAFVDQSPSKQTNLSSPADYSAMVGHLSGEPLRQTSVMFGDDQGDDEFRTPNAKSFARQKHRKPSSSEQNAHHYSQMAPSNESSPVGFQTNSDRDELNHNSSFRLMWNNTDNNNTQPVRLQASPTNQTSEDDVQLIVANSMANQRDPSSKEKLINYTSEGRNYTRAGGQKSARNTFVNKDLNELPPGDDDARLQNATATADTTTATPANQLVKLIRGSNNGSAPMELYSLSPDDQRPVDTLPRPGEDEADSEEITGTPGDDEESRAANRELLRGGQSGFGGRTARMKMGQPASEQSIDRDSTGQQRNSKVGSLGQRSTRNQRNEPQQARGAQGSGRPMGARHNKHPGPTGANEKQSPSNRHHQRQQATRRPQVTEAQFNPRHLPMEAPTPMPSVTETTVGAIVELPSKVRKLKQQPPGKDELMNELLTALDRVKTAIYKLQPLTAKMNAMYRKSITSNTRDIIMDHHKGTYSKRYPPGDFDDSYDKMHPSDVFDRQRRSSSSSSRSSPALQRIQRTNRTHPGQDQMEARGSHATPVYVAAPRELLDKLAKRSGQAEAGEGVDDEASQQQAPIIAMGVGRRMGDGSIRGKLSLSSPNGGRIVYDDRDNTGDQDHDQNDFYNEQQQQREPAMTHNIIRRNIGQSNSSRLLDDDDVQSPLFGYKITIFQSPESSLGDMAVDSLTDGTNSNASNLDAQSTGLSYSLIGSDNAGANEQVDDGNEEEEEDSMATSESTLAPSSSAAQPSNGTLADKYDLIKEASGGGRGEGDDGDVDDAEEELESDESGGGGKKKKKKKKKKKEEALKEGKKKEAQEKHKKEKKAKGEKKGEKSSKHHSKGNKEQEEHKKKKEFKKIMHKKGVMSKESHKLHRDKHVKAHDRGAAKEKALKERTQIEFFEREQIVDDEFERGKKSTVKAGWASGHDAKKSKNEIGGHADSLSMGGSHLVEHRDLGGQPSTQMMVASESGGDGAHSMAHEKGSGHSVETSSGKQTNKFIKKKMEAKGKKFKGWREKGYKIITETEFIDRGSLHDSAYKKRDKGAAHHQKFKKHEASSEGHQGAMHEHHKKSLKKEEKKKEMNEKKKETKSKKEEEAKKKDKKEAEKKKKEKKNSMEKKHEKEHDHEQEASALTMSSVDPVIESGLPPMRPVNGTPSQYHRSSGGLSTSASTLRPQVISISPVEMTSKRPGSLARLLHVDHHDDHRRLPSLGMHEISPGAQAQNKSRHLMYQLDDSSEGNNSEISRRSDDVGSSKVKLAPPATTSSTTTTTTTPKPYNLTTSSQSRLSNGNSSNMANIVRQTNKIEHKNSGREHQEEQIKLLTNLIRFAQARQDKSIVPALKSDFHDKYPSDPSSSSQENNRPELVFASARPLTQDFNRPSLFDLYNSHVNNQPYQPKILPGAGLATNQMIAATNPIQFHQSLPMFSSSPFEPIAEALLTDSNYQNYNQYHHNHHSSSPDQFGINRFESEQDGRLINAISSAQHQPIASTAYQPVINNYLGVNWVK